MIKYTTDSHYSSGKYYISLLCKEEVVEFPKNHFVIGTKLGIIYFAILSNGQTIDINKFTLKMEKRLKREQCKLSIHAVLARKKGGNLFEAKITKSKDTEQFDYT